MRSVAAGLVWTVIILIASGSFLPAFLIFPVLYFIFLVPVALTARWLGDIGVPFAGWVVGYVGLLVALGDPLIWGLQKINSNLIRVSDPAFFQRLVIVFVLKPTDIPEDDTIHEDEDEPASENEKASRDYLIQQFLENFIKGDEEWRSLVDAVKRGDHQTLDALAERGADETVRSSRGTELLAYSIAHLDDKDMVRHLLEMGAPLGQFLDGSLLHAAAIDSDDEEMFRTLIDSGENMDAVTHTRGDTTLMIAVRRNDSDHIVKLLLDRGANPHIRNNRGLSALAAAIINNNINAISFLSNAGVDVNALEGLEDGNRLAPLHLSLYGENIHVIGALLDAGAEIDLLSQGITPLFSAVRDSQPAIVRYLLNRGASKDIAGLEVTAMDVAKFAAEKPDSGSDAQEVLRLLS